MFFVRLTYITAILSYNLILFTQQMTSTMCAGIETHATKDENMEDKSFVVEMKKFLEKIL